VVSLLFISATIDRVNVMMESEELGYQWLFFWEWARWRI